MGVVSVTVGDEVCSRRSPDVLTEVRSSWGNKGDAVTPDDVAKVRKATKNVMEPYTMETLMK